MAFRIGRFDNSDRTESFNMTAVIDIVFLLIIFFLVVCQFIEAENFPVNVPDGCEFAGSDDESRGQLATITVVKTAGERCEFAVGAEKITSLSYADLVERLAELIDIRLKELPAVERVVTLRIDKNVPFAEAQYALAGIAASSATDIKLAALKDKHTNSQ